MTPATQDTYARRLIACLDVRAGRVVKGVNFEGLRDAGDPAALAARYDAEGIDELVVLDVTATAEARLALLRTVSAIAANVFIPLAVGGGIRSVEDDDLVDALGVVAGGERGRIARIAQALEVHAFHDAAGADVEARNQAAGEGVRGGRHARAPSTNARSTARPANPDFSGWNWTPQMFPRLTADANGAPYSVIAAADSVTGAAYAWVK